MGLLEDILYWSDPALPCIVAQSAHADWYTNASSNRTASCSDGLGDPEVDSDSGSTFRGVSSGTRYSVVSPDAGGVIWVSLAGTQSNVDPIGSQGGVFGSTVS